MIKKICNCFYAHKSNICEFLNKCDMYKDKVDLIITAIEPFFEYDVMKIDIKKGKLSLIQSPTFLTVNEPIVEDSIVFDLNTGDCFDSIKKKYIKARKKNKQIYHHKWMFMSDDYDKEWINKSKERSNTWASIKNINKSLIGNLDYWTMILKENGIEL